MFRILPAQAAGVRRPSSMRRALVLGLVVTTSCWHEVRRERVVLRGLLTDAGASVTLADEVHREQSCAGDKIELGVLTVLTLGLVYIINDAIESKLGHHDECPHADTKWERLQQLSTAFATVPNAPRHVATYRPRSCRFDPDDDCVTDDSIADGTIATPTARGGSRIDRGTDNAFHITLSNRVIDIGDEAWTRLGSPIAIAPRGERLVVRGPEPHTCWLVARATGAATRFDDCERARWLDPHTAWIGNRLVDVDTGETYPARQAKWLGAGLGLAGHDDVVEVVRSRPWRVVATTTPVGVVDEPDQITIIGKREVVTIRPDRVATHAIPIVPGRILDIRGDLALVTIANERLTAATIRLSTGELVARTP